MKVYGVIMAGGGGTRFWPLSRQRTPKQLLPLSGKELMINEAIDRLSGIIDEEIFIVTNEKQYEKMVQAVQSHKSIFNQITIIPEPAARNTAACIGFAAVVICHKYGDGIMCITPADHCIKNQQAFEETLKAAIKEAEKDNLLTIGIKPEFAATGFGYIRFDKDDVQASKRVIEFREKPDKDTAEMYVKSGEYLWNSGMFMWKASRILSEIQKYLPDTYKLLMEIADAFGTEQEKQIISEKYHQLQDISIDYGVMEKSEGVRVIPGTFGWNDVGSWDMMSVFHKPDKNGNILIGDTVSIESQNTTVYSDSRLTAIVGLDNIIVVETPDAVLVCSKEKAQDVKKAAELLREKGRTELL